MIRAVIRHRETNNELGWFTYTDDTNKALRQFLNDCKSNYELEDLILSNNYRKKIIRHHENKSNIFTE